MFRIVLLIIALAAGGGAAWTALAMRSDSTVTTIVQPAQPAPTQDVLVASADLGQGQALNKDNTRWQSWPESALNRAYINRSARPDAPEVLAGSKVRSRISSGEPIRDENLVALNAGFLSAMLPPGKRAVAVRISAENTAGGFILPHDRVDVLHTVANPGEGEGQKESVSRTILRNVTVLAIDQSVEEKKPDEKDNAKMVVVGKTATLELDPQQAENLAAAEATGMLSLVLRSAADNDEAPTLSRPQYSRKAAIIRGGHLEVAKTP
jgi:pilus assembly protein CpaB